MTAAPFWSADGRSILVVAEKISKRPPDFELVRCPLDSSEPARVLSLLPDPLKRVAKLRGIAIDFDREADLGVHAADLENRDSELVWSMLSDPRIQGRFHPVDSSLRIGAVSVSPDGQCAAVRFGDPLYLSHPALFHTDGEQTRLLVPDEAARRDWLRVLSTAAVRILKIGLPPFVVDGSTYERPNILPLPGELAALGNMGTRLAHLADLSESLLKARGDEHEGPPSEAEARLFFNYLRGDFRTAAADLEALDRQTTDFDQRLSILSTRALLRWAQGDHDLARQMIGYLVSTTGTASQRIEDTPLGPVSTRFVSPAQAWASFLSTRVAQAEAQVNQPGPAASIDPFEPLIGVGQGRLLDFPPDLPRGEPAGGPFAPVPAPDFNPPARP